MIESAEDLRVAVRALAGDEPDPARVTHKLLMSLAADEHRVVAMVTLAEYVRRVMTWDRGDRGADSSGEYRTQDGRTTPSAKTAAIRDWVSSELARSVNVAPAAGRCWRFFGDCTLDECLVLAGNRHRKSAELKAEAERYERLAQAMVEYKVEVVRDLPREVLEGLLRR